MFFVSFRQGKFCRAHRQKIRNDTSWQIPKTSLFCELQNNILINFLPFSCLLGKHCVFKECKKVSLVSLLDLLLLV